MDTTADAYMYAGVRMMADLWKALDHALLAAQRKVIGTKMLHRMGFISNADLEVVLAEWQPRARALPHGVTLPTGAEP